MPTLDYVPKADDAKNTWCETLKNNIVADGPTLGMTPADVTAVQTACGKIQGAISANNAAQNAAQQARKDKDDAITDNLLIIRAKVQEAKKNAAYTKGIGEHLGVEGVHTTVDTDNYKPELSAQTFPGHVTLKFTKKGVEGVNIYTRMKGQKGGWTKLSFDSHSPYVDNRPLADSETPENREYSAIGVIDDAEVGQMSDVVGVTFGG